MSITVFNPGLVSILNKLTQAVGSRIFESCNIGLFVNNRVPQQTDTIAQYTEAAWAGYARQPVTGWTGPTIVGGIGQTVGNAVLIPNTSAINQSAYGVLIFEATSGVLIAAAQFAGAPVIVSPIGLIVQVTIQDADL